VAVYDEAMNRRLFLEAVAGSTLAGWAAWAKSRRLRTACAVPPSFSVVPVVGDGKWIWTRPPEGPTGYLEPRTYKLTIAIELQGRGTATQLIATTSIPVACPEQTIVQEAVQSQGCWAETRTVGPYARQLVLRASGIFAGQSVRATLQSVVTLTKQYHGYCAEQFPQEQSVPPDVRRTYLGDSPGIQTRCPEIRALCEELSRGREHPWDRAARFAQWIVKNIRPQIGRFTSVEQALLNRCGDCEEMSAVFVALCRSAGIPARLVWVPNHNWAEFYLQDAQGQGHWIPVHLACYSWFGWTGAHELVLQKGDRLQVPERKGYFRLLEDWMRWMGKRPAVRYQAELTPQPCAPGADPGPGSRRKAASGEWQVVGAHPLNRYVRR
jgi:hypothetical protein